MLDKYLKIFGLDNNFSLDELEGKHKKLLKEFDTKNIEDDLKVIFLEEQVKIQEAYQILLKYYHKQEKAGQIKSEGKILPVREKSKQQKNQQKKIVLGIIFLLLLFMGAFFAYDKFGEGPVLPVPVPTDTIDGTATVIKGCMILTIKNTDQNTQKIQIQQVVKRNMC